MCATIHTIPEVCMVCKVYSPKHKNDFGMECRVYSKLKGTMGIPHLMCFGTRKGRNYIVMQRMFSTLEDFCEDKPDQITLASIAEFAGALVSGVISYYVWRLTIAIVESTAGHSFDRSRSW